MRTFCTLHPAAAMVYFVCVIGVAMFSTDPRIAVLSLCGAIVFYAMQRQKGLWRDLLVGAAVFAVLALANPLFSHNGRTVLFFVNGRPITWEAMAYGMTFAAVVLAMIFWFKSFQIVMTSDKLLFLFGRAAPRLSMILCSTLRYIPLFRKQTQRIREAQTAMGLYAGDNVMDDTKGTLRVFSVMVTWSLENAMDTADTMKSRGYGIGRRTLYSEYRWRPADIGVLTASLLLGGAAIVGMAMGGARFVYYPRLTPPTNMPAMWLTMIAYALLAWLPTYCELKENLRWRYCRSKI